MALETCPLIPKFPAAQVFQQIAPRSAIHVFWMYTPHSNARFILLRAANYDAVSIKFSMGCSAEVAARVAAIARAATSMPTATVTQRDGQASLARSGRRSKETVRKTAGIASFTAFASVGQRSPRAAKTRCVAHVTRRALQSS